MAAARVRRAGRLHDGQRCPDALHSYYVASAEPLASRGDAGVRGLSSVVAMSAVNFSLHSDFRWLLLVPAVIWIVGVALLATGREPPRA